LSIEQEGKTVCGIGFIAGYILVAGLKKQQLERSHCMLLPQTVFVDKRFEISNLDLAKDIIKIFKYMDSSNEIVKT